MASLSLIGDNLRCSKHTSLSSILFLQSHCGVSQRWKTKSTMLVSRAHTHMGGFSEGSVVAQQLLARTATRANRRPRAPQLKPKNCISNNLWRALSPPQERGGRGSSGLKSWFRRGFDRKVGMRRDWVGRWVVVLAWLDCRQTGFTDRCLKHLLTTPGSTLIIRDVL